MIIIGFDFDNTIVGYDDVMYTTALEKEWIQEITPKNKKEIRDHIRLLPKGEDLWTQLQAEVYGPRMSDAKLIEGVSEFIALCRLHQIKTYIISHKTEYAKFDTTNTNLREAAIIWMKQNKFFTPDGLGFHLEDVYFGSTRQEKIQFIKHLNCSHFIDDLKEVFLDPLFPAHVEKILFTQGTTNIKEDGLIEFHSWKALREYFFRK